MSSNFSEYLNKIVLVEKKNGRKFTSMLVAVDDGWLVFESRDGKRSSDRIDEVISISEI